MGEEKTGKINTTYELKSSKMSHLTVSFSFSLKARLRQGRRFYTQCKNRWGREIKNKSKERKKPQGLWDDDRKKPYKGCCPPSCQRHEGTW